jgi:hypothetical protein
MQGVRIETTPVTSRCPVCLRTIDDLTAEVEWVLKRCCGAPDSAGCGNQ